MRLLPIVLGWLVLLAGTGFRAVGSETAIHTRVREIRVNRSAQPLPEGLRELGLRAYRFQNRRGKPLPFRLAVPDRPLEGGERLPLVVWLHGAGAGGADNRRNVQGDLARLLLDPEEKTAGQCFLLFPQYRDEYNWWTYVSEKRGYKPGIAGGQTLDLIDLLCQEVPAIDSERIYVLGMSQGAFAIPHFLTAYPNRFAASVMIAGGTTIPDIPWNKNNVIPSWIFYSTDDPVAMQGGSIVPWMVEHLRGIAPEKIRVTVYEDAGHGGTLKRAMVEPGLLDWLFAQRNSRPPKRNARLMRLKFGERPEWKKERADEKVERTAEVKK